MHQTKSQEQKLKDLEQEVEILKASFKANVLTQDPSTQKLIDSTNQLNERIKLHHNSASLTPLFNGLIKALPRHCEDFIPLASGHYKPEHYSTNSLHYVHETIHIVAHALEILEIVKHAAVYATPLIGVLTRVLEMSNDHRLIHQAHHLVHQLRQYGSTQREAIYKYVILRTILNLSTRIGNEKSVDSFAGSISLQWCMILLEESISCLTTLQSCEDIFSLANKWSQSIINKFIQRGAVMPDSLPNIAARIYDKKELAIAIKVQQLFTQPAQSAPNPKPVFVPPLKNFLHDLHRNIYEHVLKPYEWRASSSYFFLSWLGGYKKESLEMLQRYQSRFIDALKIINTELRPLKKRPDSNYSLQLELINTCLYGNLNKMSQEMPWHQEAKNLFMIDSSPSLTCTLEPLIQREEGTFQIVSEIAAAKADAVKAKADAAKALAEQAKAEETATEAEERADIAEAKLAKTDAKLTETDAKLTETDERLAKTVERNKELEKTIEQLKSQIPVQPSSSSRYSFHPTASQTVQSSVIENSINQLTNH